MTLLRAEGVVAGYGPTDVLRGCDLAVHPGEVMALVGPNGAGKSTLLRVLAGLLRPRLGRALLDGRDIASLSRGAIARRVAVVPQVFETLFPFTVREIVSLGRVSRLGTFGTTSADDRAAVERALADLELLDLAERRVDRISGGERQRAVVAMALAQEGEALLLDEPTVHLDPAHQRALLVRLRELTRARGLATLAVLHDLNLAAALCARVVVLKGGMIVRDGSPTEVFTEATVAEVFGGGLVVGSHAGHPIVLPRA